MPSSHPNLVDLLDIMTIFFFCQFGSIIIQADLPLTIRNYFLGKINPQYQQKGKLFGKLQLWAKYIRNKLFR
jgi:hypothetical protein